MPLTETTLMNIWRSWTHVKRAKDAIEKMDLPKGRNTRKLKRRLAVATYQLADAVDVAQDIWAAEHDGKILQISRYAKDKGKR